MFKIQKKPVSVTKKHLLFAAFLLCGNHGLIAQDCAPKGISTDPANPVTNPGGRLNTFDYTATGWPLRTEYINGNQWIPSPFYSDDNVAIKHLYAPNDGILDMLPAGGWELIKRDFGYEDDGQASAAKAKNPFIVLYNRYTSVLRVFWARYDSQNESRAATIRLSFRGDLPMRTSLLEMSSGVKALDAAFVENQKLQSLVRFPAPFKWFYSDFQMSYDPCTCLFQSGLSISLDLSSNSQMSLNGNNITEYGAPSGELAHEGALSFGDLATGPKNGIEKYEQAWEFSENVREAIANEGDSEGKKAIGLANLVKAMKEGTFLQSGLDSVQNLTEVLGLFKFFSGGGKEGATELSPNPMLVRDKHLYSGIVQNTYQNFASIGFRTPGSDPGTAHISRYPYYNEILGVFNLLKTPKIVINREKTQQGAASYKTTFTLADDIEYALNPAAKLDIQEMRFFLSFRDERGKMRMLPFNGSNSYTNASGIMPQLGKDIMVVLNLKRQNAGPNTQNILLSFKYPIEPVFAKVKEGAAVFKTDNKGIEKFCNSAAYKTAARFPDIFSEQEANPETEEDFFEVFPNPTQGIFTLSLHKGFDGYAQIEVFNTIGEKVYGTTVDGLAQDLELNIIGRAAGLYMVRVIHKGQVYSGRVVVD